MQKVRIYCSSPSSSCSWNELGEAIKFMMNAYAGEVERRNVQRIHQQPVFPSLWTPPIGWNVPIVVSSPNVNMKTGRQRGNWRSAFNHRLSVIAVLTGFYGRCPSSDELFVFSFSGQLCPFSFRPFNVNKRPGPRSLDQTCHFQIR